MVAQVLLELVEWLIVVAENKIEVGFNEQTEEGNRHKDTLNQLCNLPSFQLIKIAVLGKLVNAWHFVGSRLDSRICQVRQRHTEHHLESATPQW
jgi:hypothetical protein